MAQLPAFCDTCGTVFPSGYGGGGGSLMFMEACKAGPCPTCGGLGTVPDGSFKMEDTLVTLLSGPATSFERIAKLAVVIRESQGQGETPEQTLNRVYEVHSSFAFLGKFLGGTSLNTYLMTLLAIGTFVLQMQQAQPLSREEARLLISQAMVMAQEQKESAKPTPVSSVSPIASVDTTEVVPPNPLKPAVKQHDGNSVKGIKKTQSGDDGDQNPKYSAAPPK